MTDDKAPDTTLGVIGMGKELHQLITAHRRPLGNPDIANMLKSMSEEETEILAAVIIRFAEQLIQPLDQRH